MAHWLCNAQLPGSFLQGRGMVKTGQEFDTPDDPDDPFFERARESWIPKDAAAEKLVTRAQKDADDIGKKNAEAAARRKQMEDDARNGILTRPFETKPESIAQQFGVNRQSEVPQGEAEQARNDAWTKTVRKQLKKGGEDDDLKQTVQDVVRENQALASNAAAQIVPDPNAPGAAAQPNNNKKK